MSRILSTCLLLSFLSQAWAEDPRLFKFYMKIEKAISRCADVTCYRKVLERYGSEDSRNRLEKSTDVFLQQTFEIEKKKAKKRIKKGEYYIVEKIVEENKARLRIASKSYRALNETIYFVKEEGKWKFGKESKKKKEGDKEASEHKMPDSLDKVKE